ncbi:hypothetical protein Sant_1394 [Sodalis praecaptivus]|uniref:Uncharacterized protein n=1 Tax=Sodalis praecaptivus TaxID=1239307 RepID=W0HVD1_9GAMM|nr:hypothetical protein [Sodalis praecaptivus]AHF76452.1 hypothetical protein Sant_1394 [Sodalis praecaptivus]
MMPISSVALQNNLVGKYYNARHDKNKKIFAANRRDRILLANPAGDNNAAGRRIFGFINGRNEMNDGPPRLKQSKIANLLTLLSLLHQTRVIDNLPPAAAHVGMDSTALTLEGSPLATAAPLAGLYLPAQSNVSQHNRRGLSLGNLRTKRSADTALHERMDDILILKTAENSYPTAVNALNRLYHSIAMIRNETIANESYGLLIVAKRMCKQAENLLEAARLVKHVLDKQESHIKENNFSPPHILMMKNISEDLRNDAVKKAWNAYQSFRICYTIACSEEKFQILSRRISKTYASQQEVAVAVVEEELSKNSHVLGLSDEKLNHILDDIKNAIKAYAKLDKAPYYQSLINQGYPGIAVLSIANKHFPLTSSLTGIDNQTSTPSLMDKANQEFIARYVMPCEEKAKLEAQKNQTLPHTLSAAGGGAAGAVGVGGGAYYLFNRKKHTGSPTDVATEMQQVNGGAAISPEEDLGADIAEGRVMEPPAETVAQIEADEVMASAEQADSRAGAAGEMASAARGDIQADAGWIREPAGGTVIEVDAEVALAPAAETTLAEDIEIVAEAMEELAVENLEIGAEEIGTAVAGSAGAVAAVAAYEAVKEVGTAFVETLAESAAESLSEAMQEAVSAVFKSAAGAMLDESTVDAVGVTAGEAMIESAVDKINAKIESRLANKLKQPLRMR